MENTERVLKLNSSYEPVEVVSWKKAIKLVSLEKAEVIKEYDKNLTASIKFPAVIRLLKPFKRVRRKIRFNKHNVYARDGWKCQYCGQGFNTIDLTLDHVVPRSRAEGKTTWNNVVSCCKECNRKKGNKTPVEAGMMLKKVPIEPNWIPILLFNLSHSVLPEQWNDFCFITK